MAQMFVSRPCYKLDMTFWFQILNVLSTSFSDIRSGTTNTQSAIALTYSTAFTAARGDRDTAQNIAVLVTDGGSNVLSNMTLPEAANAKQRGIEMYVVGAGTEVNLAEIYGIASNATLDHVVLFPRPQDAATVASTLLDRMCR
jgi:hypothetical protein